MQTPHYPRCLWPAQPLAFFRLGLLVAACWLLGVGPAPAAQPPRQVLRGHARAITQRLSPLSRVDTNAHLNLSIDLPLRNKDRLTNLLQELYQPGSTNFRHFLKPGEFAANFGPTKEDYQAVVNFANSHGLKVTRTHSNRTLVSVSGSVADIENAFHTRLHVYQHPKEARTFFAPDSEPSLDLATPVLAISGLDNYELPKPNVHPYVRPAVHPLGGGGGGAGGTSPNGAYIGYDFQTAYLPNTLAAGVLDGTGQSIALFELGGYNPQDIDDYIANASLPGVPLQDIYIDGFSGDDSDVNFAVEVTSDIEVAMSMAPGLDAIYVYQGAVPTGDPPYTQSAATTAEINDIFNQIAVDDFAKQVSCSYGLDINAATIQIFQQFAAQGQSFFQASGDTGAYPGAVASPSDSPYITIVGGTDLFTDPDNAGAWYDEEAWLSPPGVDPVYGLPTPYAATGGGISTTYPIPWWQQGLIMTTNQGSTTKRNLPDVASVADNIDIWWGNDYLIEDYYTLSGTSLAAPLWAAFTALVNQQGAAHGQPPVGFLNPSLYAIGKSASYLDCFRDINTGVNTNTSSPTKYFAVDGYDLCTGWGSMNDPLIDALLNPPVDSLQVNPPFGFTAFGPYGVPFGMTSQTYTLKNTGGSPLNWRLTNSANWLSVTSTNGTLAAGASTTVTINLNSGINNFLILSTNANVTFANLTSGTWQNRQFDLHVANGGFETGSFSNWTLTGSTARNFPLSGDDVQVAGQNALTGVADELFIHSGLYGAYLGQTSTDATFSQNVATVPGQVYLVSFSLTGVASQSGSATPNDFIAKWNGSVIYGKTNLTAFGWTNFQFLLPATSSSTALQFVFHNNPGAFGLDDVSVVASPAGFLRSAARNSGNFQFSWTSFSNALYQIQATTNLVTSNWSNASGIATLTTNGSQINATVPIGSNSRQFYRVVVTNQ